MSITYDEALHDCLVDALGKLAGQCGLKVAEVSSERARRAMDRLSSMEDTKPTVGQVARYAGIGGRWRGCQGHRQCD
jgi:hypothetical protein